MENMFLSIDGIEIEDLEEGDYTAYEEELGTNEEAGTPPGSIVSFFEENSVTVTAKENRTTPELASALYQGHPVLLCIQAWAAAEDGYNTQNSDDADTYLAEGHWVIWSDIESSVQDPSVRFQGRYILFALCCATVCYLIC